MVAVLVNGNLIRRTLIDNGSGLNVCSLDMLKAINVDMSTMKLDNLPICGFDNISKKNLEFITLPIKVDPIVLDTLIHVMPGLLNYNLLLGRLWLHNMRAIPSTLHCKVKFIYENVMCTLHADNRPNNRYNVESFKVSGPREEKLKDKFETNNQSSEEPSFSFSNDDWGTLEFNPTFIGEYKVSNLYFMKEPKQP